MNTLSLLRSWMTRIDRRRTPRRTAFHGLQFRPLEDRCTPAVFFVTTTADSGIGSLRQAILDSELLTGADQIRFAIAGTGIQTIDLGDFLPVINDALVIDGYSQTGSAANSAAVGTNAVVDIEIRGTAIPNGVGLEFGATAAVRTIRGLSLTGFSSAGILLSGASGVAIEGNFIGVRPDGSNGANGTGVRLAVGSNGNTVGGTTPAQVNLISGNSTGVALVDGGTNNNFVQGNLIGTKAAGTAAFLPPTPNVIGVSLDSGASNNTIGGTNAGARNVISGLDAGVVFNGGGTQNNTVAGNYIGTNAAGTASISNETGIVVNGTSNNTIGGMTAAHRNVISGNNGVGIIVNGAAGLGVFNNFIGTDATGNVAVANRGVSAIALNVGADGVAIGAVGAGNLISGNSSTGILFQSAVAGNTVRGNTIGLNLTKTAALGNLFSGIDFEASNETIIYSSTFSGNALAGNGTAFRVRGAGITLSGFRVGVTDDGSAALYADGRRNGIGILVSRTNITIVGAVVGGNSGDGIVFGGGAEGSKLFGSFVGTDISGNTAIANGGNGVGIFGTGSITVGGSANGAGNVISGNAGNGIRVDALDSSVLGNRIGTNAAGTDALGNGGSGISLGFGSGSNGIGGPGAGEGNLISGNLGNGISDSGLGNAVRGNRVGTDAAGAAVLGNLGSGIALLAGAASASVGGSAPGEGNTVRGNRGDGVLVDGVGTGQNRVSGNLIADNGGNGIAVSGGATFTSIGDRFGVGNRIENNAGAGVAILGDTSVNNAIVGNSIAGNGGPGIDLGGDGPTANRATQPATGPNSGQNYPVLTSVTSTTISGTLFGQPNTNYRLEFYAGAVVPSGFAQAEVMVASVVVTTDAAGNATFSLAYSLQPGPMPVAFTATATRLDSEGSSVETSEFAPPLLTKIGISGGGGIAEGGSVPLTVVRSGDISQATVVAIRVTGARTGLPPDLAIAGATYDPASGMLFVSFAADETSKTFSLAALRDGVFEPGETLDLNVLPGPYVVDLPMATARVTVAPDILPTIALDGPALPRTESEGAILGWLVMGAADYPEVRVSLTRDGVVLATSAAASGRFDVAASGPGDYRLRVEVFDATGASVASSSRSATVIADPVAPIPTPPPAPIPPPGATPEPLPTPEPEPIPIDLPEPPQVLPQPTLPLLTLTGDELESLDQQAVAQADTSESVDPRESTAVTKEAEGDSSEAEARLTAELILLRAVGFSTNVPTSTRSELEAASGGTGLVLSVPASGAATSVPRPKQVVVVAGERGEVAGASALLEGDDSTALMEYLMAINRPVSLSESRPEPAFAAEPTTARPAPSVSPGPQAVEEVVPEPEERTETVIVVERMPPERSGLWVTIGLAGFVFCRHLRSLRDKPEWTQVSRKAGLPTRGVE